MPTEDIKTVGPGKQYADLHAWHTGESRDVVTPDVIPVAECYGGADLLGGSFLNLSGGWVTDTDHPIIIRAAAGERFTGGSWDPTKAHGTSGSPTFHAILTGQRHVVLDGMQIKSTAAPRIFGTTNGGGNGQCIARGCLFISENSTEGRPCIDINYNGDPARIENCVILMNGTRDYFIAFAVRDSVALTHEVYNNTIIGRVNGSPGIHWGIYTVDAFSTVDSDNNYIAANSAYNQNGSSTINKGPGDVTSGADATTPALRNVGYTTDNFVNVTVGSEDLTPTSDSALLDVGTDLTAAGITNDMLGNPRPSGAAFDAGAIELEQLTSVIVALGLGGSGAMSVSATPKRISSFAFHGSSGATIESVRKKVAALGFAGTSGLAVDQIAKLEATLAMGGSGGMDFTTGALKVIANLDLGGTGGLSVTVGTLRKVIALAFAGEGGLSLAAEALIEDGFVQAASRVIFAMKSMTEGAIYYPGGNLGAGKSIRVVCEREPVATLEFSEYTQGRSIVIELARDATLGVLEVRENEDKIDVALVHGKPKERLLVNSILESDAGVYRILATK